MPIAIFCRIGSVNLQDLIFSAVGAGIETVGKSMKSIDTGQYSNVTGSNNGILEI